MDLDCGVSFENLVSRLGARRLVAHSSASGLRSDPPAEAAGSRREPRNLPLQALWSWTPFPRRRVGPLLRSMEPQPLRPRSKISDMAIRLRMQSNHHPRN